MSAQYFFLSFAPCPIKENGVTMQIFRRVCLCERASQKTIRHEASQGHIHFVDVFTLMDTGNCVCAQSHLTLCNPMDYSSPDPLSMGFLWQEYWSVLPFPPPGNLPDPGIEPTSSVSLALADGFLTISATWEPTGNYIHG